jgi:hypothetical protein
LLLFTITLLSNCIYLFYNNLRLSILGGEHRPASVLDSIRKYTLENVLRALNFVNPIISIKILEPKGMVIFIVFGIILIDLFFLLSYIWFYQILFKSKIQSFHQLLLIISS